MSLKKIMVLFKTHLDIGFTDFSAAVTERYMKDFVPNAIKTAKALKEKNSEAKFIWSTGSWLIREFLLTQDEESVKALEAAIKAGDISWHGLPFTHHTEIMDKELFEYGLSMSKELDERFGKKTIAAKMTDVPGHTKAIIPMLKKAGIEFLHLGVNAASAVPEVPLIFRWQAENGDKITVMYNLYYGTYAELGSSGTAIYFAHTNDNLGGQSPEEVEAIFAELKEKYPEAEIVAADLNDVAVALRDIEDELPVVTKEIGDSWIYGTGSDPKKVSQYRALLKFAEGLPEGEDRETLFRYLVMIPEHTWGMDEKTHLDDNFHYKKEEFYPLRTEPNYKKFEASWAEQRAYITDAVAKLSPENKLKAEAFLNEYRRDAACCCGLAEVPVGEKVKLGDFSLSFNPQGEIDFLTYKDKAVADAEHRLGKLIYEQFCVEDFSRFYKQYTRDDYWWAFLDFQKIGMESGVDKHYTFTPSAKVYADDNKIVVKYSFEPVANERFGCPAENDLIITAKGDELHFDLAWNNKPANRMGEAMWFGFEPIATAKKVRKLGEWIDPNNFVNRAGRRLQATDFGVKYDELTIETLDTHLVAPQEPSLLNFIDDEPTDDGVYFNLHNNLWGTNFPMWYEDDARFRFILKV